MDEETLGSLEEILIDGEIAQKVVDAALISMGTIHYLRSGLERDRYEIIIRIICQCHRTDRFQEGDSRLSWRQNERRCPQSHQTYWRKCKIILFFLIF